MKRWLIVLFLLIGFGAQAQTDFERYLSLSWNVNTPLSNHDYIQSTSTRGFGLGYHNKVTDNFFLGIDFNNATFDEYKPRQTYYSENGAITTDFFDYTYYYGLTLSGNYFFAPSSKVSPFAGLGLGANYNSYKRYFNIYADTDSSWGLLVRPEVGAMIKFGAEESWGLTGSVYMDYSTAESKMAGYNGISTWGFKLGIIITEWR